MDLVYSIKLRGNLNDDPMSCIAVITSASGAISSAIKAGKDISSLSVPLQKYAKAEAELNFGAQRKKNSFLG